MMARPDRLSIRFSTTNRVKSMSAKPMPNVAILFTPVAPAGPFTSSLPATFGFVEGDMQALAVQRNIQAVDARCG